MAALRPHRVILAVIVGSWIVAAPPMEGRASPAAARSAGPPIKTALERFLAGALAADELSIVYDDISPYHGGIRLEVSGSGAVVQRTVLMEKPAPRALGPEEVRELVRLVLEAEAWEQRARPGDGADAACVSTARLELRAGRQKTTIWEWWHERRRLGPMLSWLKVTAWRPEGYLEELRRRLPVTSIMMSLTPGQEQANIGGRIMRPNDSFALPSGERFRVVTITSDHVVIAAEGEIDVAGCEFVLDPQKPATERSSPR